MLSVGSFLLYGLFVSLEKRRGRRFLLDRFREVLDNIVVAIATFFAKWYNYLSRYIIQLSWYYSIHKFLRFILTFLVKSYDKLELAFMNNKARARVLKNEKRSFQNEGHLQKVAEHKVSTTLTDKQKERLKAQKLEGN